VHIEFSQILKLPISYFAILIIIPLYIGYRIFIDFPIDFKKMPSYVVPIVNILSVLRHRRNVSLCRRPSTRLLRLRSRKTIRFLLPLKMLSLSLFLSIDQGFNLWCYYFNNIPFCKILSHKRIFQLFAKKRKKKEINKNS